MLATVDEFTKIMLLRAPELRSLRVREPGAIICAKGSTHAEEALRTSFLPAVAFGSRTRSNPGAIVSGAIGIWDSLSESAISLDKKLCQGALEGRVVGRGSEITKSDWRSVEPSGL